METHATASLARPAQRAGWQPSGVEGLQIAPLQGDWLPGACRHAFTVDVEDWPQSVYDRSLPVSQRFVAGTLRIAELLQRHQVHATFFVLGNAAKAAPRLIVDLADAGHEIQTHGYQHREIHAMTPEEFRQDTLRAKGVLEDLLGRPITGYRAPRFSIDRTTSWALDLLADCGFAYDSSIFPMRIRGYGIAGWPRTPHHILTRAQRRIIEVPVATGTAGGRRVPLGGGGYFRVLPAGLIIRQLDRLAASGLPAVLYCHPHEFDAHAFTELPFKVPLRQRVHQGLGRRTFASKIEQTLRRYRFGTIGDLLGPHLDHHSATAPNTCGHSASIAVFEPEPAIRH